MRIDFHGDGDLELALREIHRRACAYEGPLMYEFMELAKLSAPVEPDEPDEPDEPTENVFQGDGFGTRDTEAAKHNETKERFEAALSLLMVLAFPVNSGTAQAVRRELNETLERGQQIESMQMRVGNRKTSLRANLGRRPTRQQVALLQALLKFLPGRSQEDL